MTGDRWIGATGRPTTFNGQAVPRHSPCGSLAEARLAVSGAGLGALGDQPYTAAVKRLVQETQTASFTVNAYAYGLLALGTIEVAYEAPDAMACALPQHARTPCTHCCLLMSIGPLLGQMTSSRWFRSSLEPGGPCCTPAGCQGRWRAVRWTG